MTSDQIGNLCGYLGAGIGIVMFLPQAFDIFKTHNTKSISLLTFLLVTVGSVFWLVYGVLQSAFPVIIVNIVILFLSTYIVMMKLRFR